MKDISVAVRRFLLVDAGVSALVDDRVYVDDLPAEQDQNMPQNCVVLRSAGGPALPDYTHMQRQRYDVLSFGKTRYEAGRVDSAVAEAFHYMRRTVVEDTLLHSTVINGGASSFKTARTGWPVKMRSIIVNGSINEAS